MIAENIVLIRDTADGYTITGWGIVAIIILFMGLRYVAEGFRKGGD